MFCTKCGTPNNDDSKFCCGCGEPLNASYKTVNEEPASEYANPADTQHNYNQTANAPYKAPITGRNIALCLILTIVTCGIYGIYWFIKIVDDLNVASQSNEDTNGVTVFLLGLVTCGIYSLYWFYKAGEKVNKVRAFNGRAAGDLSLLYLFLAIFSFGIVNYVLIQSELNNVAAVTE